MDYASNLLPAHSVLKAGKQRSHSAIRLDKMTEYSIQATDLDSKTFDNRELLRSQRAIKKRKFKIVNPLTAARTSQDCSSDRSIQHKLKSKTVANTRPASPINTDMVTPELCAEIVRDYLLPMFKTR